MKVEGNVGAAGSLMTGNFVLEHAVDEATECVKGSVANGDGESDGDNVQTAHSERITANNLCPASPRSAVHKRAAARTRGEIGAHLPRDLKRADPHERKARWGGDVQHDGAFAFVAAVERNLIERVSASALGRKMMMRGENYLEHGEFSPLQVENLP